MERLLSSVERKTMNIATAVLKITTLIRLLQKNIKNGFIHLYIFFPAYVSLVFFKKLG